MKFLVYYYNYIKDKYDVQLFEDSESCYQGIKRARIRGYTRFYVYKLYGRL